MLGAQDFAAADPRTVAPQLNDAVHVWRLPYRREHGRAPLLALLADYLHVDAASLRLQEGAHGKPSLLLHDGSASDLRFNWSHSGNVALVALARDLEVGVDIEQARADLRAVELARRFFAPAEAAALAACAEGEREDVFLQLWCAKEAVLKALGRGLAFGLERIEFAPSRNGWSPNRFDTEAGEAREWRVVALRPALDCTAALAWRGSPRTLLGWAQI